MRKFGFLLFLAFSPVAIATGVIGIPEKGKLKIEMEETKPISKTVKEESNCDSLSIAIETLSNWQLASGTYYDPKDTSQTKEGGDGKGAFERMIQSGSIALGSSFTKFFVKEKRKMKVFIETNLNVMTPFGKGIFRLDDKMAGVYSIDNHYFLDFIEENLTKKLKQVGRFDVLFRIHKIEFVE
jgi:hypothetical protein